MLNNKELIIPLLKFENKGDFYMLYILKRKKDQPEGEKDNNQSVRTIKTYCVDSTEYLEKRWDEITHLCEHFKARAYIHVTRQNHKDVGLEMMVQLATRLKDGHSVFRNLFDSVVGQIKTYSKLWIVDIDTHSKIYTETIAKIINSCDPNGQKIIETIPTKSGCHLITVPFNVMQFNNTITPEMTKPDIQKKNPTLLFLPNSLI